LAVVAALAAGKTKVALMNPVAAAVVVAQQQNGSPVLLRETH
jgi:hypothetical protein